MLKDKNILIGVSSGIAIYKVLDLISRLKKKEARVQVIMTPNASEFISPLLFEVMSRSNVYLDQFAQGGQGRVSHICLAKEADAFLLAPATANTISKLAHGIADNLLTTTALAYSRPLVIAPTMNTKMLNNPLTQENIACLKNLGHEFIETDQGFLACNEVGDGRMAEPQDILDYLVFHLTNKDLSGKKILVSAGPTFERIDPVRYISNDSSGKMGYALAKAARNRGAEVVLVAGRNSLEEIKGIKTCHVESNQDMFKKLDKYFWESDALIMAAAPSDYRPAQFHQEKIKKKEGQSLSLDLVENQDIVGYFAQRKEARVVIGFAAETDNLLDNARSKLERKNLDYILANDVSKEDRGFDTDKNAGYLLSKDGTREIGLVDKFDMANIILDVLVNA